MISFTDYTRLLEDRPDKFAEADVGFERNGGDATNRCGRCFHFFTNPVSPSKVCEIMRPDDDSPIHPKDICDFYTRDGVSYPRLEGGATPAEADSEEKAQEDEDEAEDEDIEP